MATYRLDLAYDGTDFHGWARQPQVRTVQGELETALARRFGPVDTTVAGRTDAGVHARGQVVSFETDLVEPDRLVASLNKMLAPEIVVSSCRLVEDGFSARFSAVSRTYRYRLLAQPLPDPFFARTTWHVGDQLDLGAMQHAAGRFVGEHDFASFCRKGRSTVRTVLRAEWIRDGSFVDFWVGATSFCHQMVRSLVAVGVDVGRGKVHPEDVPAIIEAKDRSAARGAAPPHGLTLWEVGYPADAS